MIDINTNNYILIASIFIQMFIINPYIEPRKNYKFTFYNEKLDYLCEEKFIKLFSNPFLNNFYQENIAKYLPTSCLSVKFELTLKWEQVNTN